MFQTFNGLIVIVDMGNFQFRIRHRLFVYGISMVLGSDEATSDSSSLTGWLPPR